MPDRRTAEEISETNRANALKRWAKTIDRQAETYAARQAFIAKFEEEADPLGVLPAYERARRGKVLRHAYMRDLSKRRHRKGEQGENPAQSS